MEVEFRTTKADFMAYYRYYFFRRNSGVRIAFVIIVALWIGAVRGADQPFHIPVFLLHTLIAGPVIALLLFVLPYGIAVGKLRKLVKAKGFAERNYKITLTADGLSVQSPVAGASEEGKVYKESEFWRWESVRTAGSGGGFIFIQLFHRVVYVISRHYFHSDNEANNFTGFIRNGIERVRGSGIASKKARARRLYWWGLVGVIPNFGVIAGLILFFKGLFQFKDGTLVVIGVADILFTVLFWWAIDQWQMNSDGFIRLETKVSQDQLNNLFRNIEFYKLQHGVYPDSLKQIEKADAYVWINDPLQQRHLKSKSVNYFYQRVGAKYWLFSVGLDGKPFTKDDIFPTMNPADTVKFGLLLR